MAPSRSRHPPAPIGESLPSCTGRGATPSSGSTRPQRGPDFDGVLGSVARIPWRGAEINVLVLNSGSSTVRFQIIETDLETIRNDADRRLARGLVERIGGHALLRLESEGKAVVHEDAPLRDH